tara:strand:+ start:5983 stop:10020 length:4038 start_codon:yes stop_codon:yes gene_type:complete
MSYNIFDRPESVIGSRSFGRKKTLDDLEKDEKFLETSERFLASVGENSDDIFEYLRDSDFNLYSGMKRAMQSGNFTEQQKKDYAYLRKEFDNADLGSLKQFAGLIGDAGIDIATDPTVIVAALAAPFTGGTSLATRTGIAATGLKTAKNFIGPPVPPSLATGALKTEGKKSVKKAATVAGAEVGAWLGLDNHFRQSTELNTNLRKMYSTPELAGSIALGALTGGLIGGGIQKANLFYSKMNRLYSDPDYLKTEAGSFADKVYKTLEIGDKIKSKTIGAATSILDTKAKFSPIARTLGKLFREDFDKRLGTITREKVDLGHGEILDNLRGEYHALFDEATAPLRKTGVMSEANELQVIKLLRGDDPAKYSNDVQQVALDLRVLLNRVFDDAIDAGLIKPDRKLEDYFPRSWNRRAIQENRDIFEELLVSEKIVKDRTKAAELTDEMLNKNNELFSSHSILLTQARAFKDLNENVFEDFLTNDLNTLMNYYMNAANTIQHKKSFLLEGFSRKSNVNQFIERWITPMDRELRKARGGRGLNRAERRDIVNLYKSVTGQVNYFDSGLMQGVYDATKLANAMAYLPLATVSSLTEAMIPLTKTGGSVTAPVKDALKGVKEGHKIFVQDIPLLLKQKYKMTDSQIQKEMNQVFLAMDEAFAETTNRLSGEGLQNEFLKKVGRGFFRFNMLIPWTKSVQLASFNIGKNLIEEHLQTLNKLSKEGVDVITETATKDLSRAEIRNIQKIKSELFGLGIDIKDGLRWIDDGAKRGFGPARENNVLTGEIAYDDNFYKSVIQGAGRFVNEVIMPVGRDRARIPTFMTNPKLDIFTQFLRYPTVFSNTVLKNYINSVIVNPKVNAPKLGAFALSATSLALATNYWRSNEENRDRIAQEGFSKNDVTKAFQRVGLLGPMEYGLRYGDSIEYTKNPYVSAAGLGGPLASDLTGLFLGRYGLTETVARKTPLIGTKPLMNKYFGANIYDPITTSAREIDKEIGYKLGIKERPQSRRYSPTYEMSYRREYSVGGLIPEGPEVPFTKDNPADRVNPYTGEPYQDQMDRLGFNTGGRNIFSNLVDSIKERLPAEARIYYDKVIKQDKNPITEKDFTEEEYQNIKNHFKKTLINDIKSGKVTFDDQGKAQYIRQFGSRTFTKPVISGYNPVEAKPEDLEFQAKMGIEFQNLKPSDGKVKDFTNVFGNASYSFTKDGYENSTASIDDVYDFNFEYAGGFNKDRVLKRGDTYSMMSKNTRILSDTQEGQGLLNPINRTKYRSFLGAAKPFAILDGNFNSLRPLLERYAAFRLPDEETAKLLEKEYQPVNVKVNMPIKDIFTKEEFDNLFNSEQTKRFNSEQTTGVR